MPDFYPAGFLPNGVRLSGYFGDASDLPQAVLQDFLDAVAAGEATVPIAKTYTMDEIATAHDDMEHDDVRGARDLDGAPGRGALGHHVVRAGGDVAVELAEDEPARHGAPERLSPDGSFSAASVIGRWVTAMSAPSASGRSAENWWWYLAWSM